ncbi:hypothetical protein ACFE04_021389 [Oxalis oulophora]
MQSISCLSFFLLFVIGGGVIFYYESEKKIYIQDTVSMLVYLMLLRNVVDERVVLYLWKTYTEVYDEILLVGVALRLSGAKLACGGHSLVCVPPYIPLILNPTYKSAERLKSKND